MGETVDPRGGYGAIIRAMKLDFQRSHGLDLTILKQRVEARVAHYAGLYPALQLPTLYRWETERVVSASYRGATGRITLGDRDARVAIDLPFLARPFKSKIETFVSAEMDRVLATEVLPA